MGLKDIATHKKKRSQGKSLNWLNVNRAEDIADFDINAYKKAKDAKVPLSDSFKGFLDIFVPHFAPVALGSLALAIAIFAAFWTIRSDNKNDLATGDKVEILSGPNAKTFAWIASFTPEQNECTVKFNDDGHTEDTLKITEVSRVEVLSPSSFIDHSKFWREDCKEFKVTLREGQQEDDAVYKKSICDIGSTQMKSFVTQRFLRMLFGHGGRLTFVLANGMSPKNQKLLKISSVVVGVILLLGACVVCFIIGYKALTKPATKTETETETETLIKLLLTKTETETAQADTLFRKAEDGKTAAIYGFNCDKKEGMVSLLLMLGIGFLVMNFMFGMELFRCFSRAHIPNLPVEFGTVLNLMMSNIFKVIRVFASFGLSPSLEDAVTCFLPSEACLIGLSAACCYGFEKVGVDFNPQNKEELVGHFLALLLENSLKTIFSIGVSVLYNYNQWVKTTLLGWISRFLTKINGVGPKYLVLFSLTCHGCLDVVQFFATGLVKESAKTSGIKNSVIRSVTMTAESERVNFVKHAKEECDRLKKVSWCTRRCGTSELPGNDKSEWDVLVTKIHQMCPNAQLIDSEGLATHINEKESIICSGKVPESSNFPSWCGKRAYSYCGLGRLAAVCCISMEDWFYRGVAYPLFYNISHSTKTTCCFEQTWTEPEKSMARNVLVVLDAHNKKMADFLTAPGREN